jgi:hypothetical protein
MSTILGKPTSRIDGRAKVTGAARYAAEYNVPDLAHGFVVGATGWPLKRMRPSKSGRKCRPFAATSSS